MPLVGYSNRTRYWQIYAFNNPPKDYSYRRAKDIPFHLTSTNNQFLLNTKWMLPFQNCDLFHTYNSIVTGQKPWVVEVESSIPRYGSLKRGDRKFDWGVNKLRSDICRAIIFTSESARKLNRKNFDAWNINEEKCHVVYRAVEPYKRLQRNGKQQQFTILFVGNAFYRKGGIELLKAFKRFKRKDVRLVIVSSFEVDWEVHPTDEDIRFVKEEIKKNEQIELYQNIPHKEVVNWMRRSDVFVSTTFADPFNNTILEAMACGVPIISSTVRAIPEFVSHGYNGYLTDVEKKNNDSIVDFIENKLNTYFDDTNLLKEHSKNSYNIIESNFLLDHRNKKLKHVYDESIM